MFEGSNAPAIPERTSARTSLAPRERKRRSLPASAQRDDAGRRSSNRVVVKPASTEVISSLIETLSAISSPAEHHFDTMPNISASHSSPASPSPWQTEVPEKGASGSSAYEDGAWSGVAIDTGRRGRPNGARDFLHPDQASSASLRGSSTGQIPSERSLRHSSKMAIYNGLDEAYSIGNLSIEPQPWQSSTSLASAGNDKRKSLKSVRSTRSFRNLGLKTSRDSMRDLDPPKPRKARGEKRTPQERLILDGSRSPSPPADRIHLSKRTARTEDPDSPPVLPESPVLTLPPTSPRRLYWNSEDAYAGPGNQNASPTNLSHQETIPARNSSVRSHDIPRRESVPTRNSSVRSHKFPHHESIPTRDSSIRHSFGSSPRKRNSRSQPSEEIESRDTEHEVVLTPSDASPPIAEELSGDSVEDGISRRIRELKDQKKQRDRLSMESMPESLPPLNASGRIQSPAPVPDFKSQQPVDLKTSVTVDEDERLSLQEFQTLEDDNDPAPSPAIAQRIDRSIDNHARSPGGKPDAMKSTVTNGKDLNRRTSLTSPQRSNSRLLRRLSQPASPISTEKNKTRISNPPSQPLPSVSHETDGGDSIDDAVEDFLTSPRLSHKITHPQTGRVISFSEVGDPDGSAVFCCVGMGLTRYITAFYDELATTLKLRLITPDRPGVGGSEPHADGLDTPLGWPDDVRCICEHLRISKFSILAHSAGAIYALATALRMPQHIRCRVHLLAPWIPPSQMSAIGTHQEPLPATALPYSQRFLRSLPTTFLRAANSSFLSVTSNSITTSLPKPPRRSKRKSISRSASQPADLLATTEISGSDSPTLRRTVTDHPLSKENKPPLPRSASANQTPSPHPTKPTPSQPSTKTKDDNAYDHRLTTAIWTAATTAASPATDLIVCLERRHPIGFRYVDITRAVVIHHGSKDTRVPLENVKWLGNMMRRCEVRVLEGEGHGLMARAGVMGGVLMEISSEWADWNRVVRGKGERRGTNGG